MVALVAGALTASVGPVIDYNNNQPYGTGVHAGPGLAVEAVGLGLTVVGALAVLLNGTTWAVTRRVDAPAPAGSGLGLVAPKVKAWLDFDPARHQVVLAGRS
jgi:hypothetical protein